MTNLGNAKILGGIGAILLLIGWFTHPALSLVGFILVLIAVKFISDEFKDKSVFNNFLLFVILGIIAIITLSAVVTIAINKVGGFSIFTSEKIKDAQAFMDTLKPVLPILILGFIIFCLLNIIGSLYLKKSFQSIASHTKVDMFKTTGFVYFIGALLLIIVVGFVVVWIATILMIIAFFSLPDNLSQTSSAVGQTGRICPNCGRPIPMDAQICPYCGKDYRKQ